MADEQAAEIHQTFASDVEPATIYRSLGRAPALARIFEIHKGVISDLTDALGAQPVPQQD